MSKNFNLSLATNLENSAIPLLIRSLFCQVIPARIQKTKATKPQKKKINHVITNRPFLKRQLGFLLIYPFTSQKPNLSYRPTSTKLPVSNFTFFSIAHLYPESHCIQHNISLGKQNRIDHLLTFVLQPRHSLFLTATKYCT